MSQVEHTIKTLTLDANLQSELEKLQAEGWQLVSIPNVSPVVTYHLVRGGDIPVPDKPATNAAVANIIIDDSKVMILGANGELR